jgi:hypothetical protein
MEDTKFKNNLIIKENYYHFLKTNMNIFFKSNYPSRCKDTITNNNLNNNKR